MSDVRRRWANSEVGKTDEEEEEGIESEEEEAAPEEEAALFCSAVCVYSATQTTSRIKPPAVRIHRDVTERCGDEHRRKHIKHL